jgi:hypothetical protein
MLQKKSNSICYHAVCEAAAMKEILTTHESTLTNLADLFTKVGLAAREVVTPLWGRFYMT